MAQPALGRLQGAAEVSERPGLTAYQSERAAAGDRFDPADPGRDGRLADYPKKPDLARGGAVQPAAELAGVVARGYDAHAVAVLLAEKGHSSPGLGFFEVGPLKSHRNVPQYRLVDHVLDAIELLLGQSLQVREVEAQAVGSDP